MSRCSKAIISAALTLAATSFTVGPRVASAASPVLNGSSSENGWVGMLAVPRAGNITGICTATLLCSGSGGSVFLSADHCKRGLSEGSQMRVVMAPEVTQAMAYDPSSYYPISQTQSIMLGAAMDNGTEIQDGIMVMKTNYRIDKAPYPLATVAPSLKSVYTDGKRYGKLVGYGPSNGVTGVWPMRRTFGWLEFRRIWRAPAVTNISPSGSDWLGSANDAGTAITSSVSGDSGAPILGDGDEIIYAINFGTSTTIARQSAAFNVSSVKRIDSVERIRNQITTIANQFVPGCISETTNTESTAETAALTACAESCQQFATTVQASTGISSGEYTGGIISGSGALASSLTVLTSLLNAGENTGVIGNVSTSLGGDAKYSAAPVPSGTVTSTASDIDTGALSAGGNPPQPVATPLFQAGALNTVDVGAPATSISTVGTGASTVSCLQACAETLHDLSDSSSGDTDGSGSDDTDELEETPQVNELNVPNEGA